MADKIRVDTFEEFLVLLSRIMTTDKITKNIIIIFFGLGYAYILTFIIVHTHTYPRTYPYLYAYSPS